MRRQKPQREPTMQMRRRDGARDVPSRTPAAAPGQQAAQDAAHEAAQKASHEDGDMLGFRGSIDTDTESVQHMHAAMYRRLRRHMELHRSILTDDAWKLLTRVAFALYVDSLEPGEMEPLPREVSEPSRGLRVPSRRR